MVRTTTKQITLADFLRLPETKPASEFINGQIIQKPMPQGKHSILQGKLVDKINQLLSPDKLAYAFPELRCTFGDRSVVPDISVYIWESVPVDTDGEIANQFGKPPNWMIEILSPGQSSIRVTSKILFCLEHGTVMGWLIDPAEKIVIVYQQDRAPIAVEMSEQLLPVPSFAQRLHIPVNELFELLKFS
ncbi:MAG: Uma2 family endonuclease [Cyanobacteria bacterium J06614_10]